MKSSYDWRKLRAPLELICLRLCKCFLLHGEVVMLPPKQAITADVRAKQHSSTPHESHNQSSNKSRARRGGT